VEVSQVTLQAMHLIIFARKHLNGYIHHIETGSVPTGIGRMMGNKGGVAIGFSISNTSMLFIHSHFAAHQDKVEQRNNDFHTINSRLSLHQKALERNPLLTNVSDRYDRVFWLGDLNYRVAAGNRRMVDSLIKQNMIEVLLANDQLNVERESGNVFRGFIEGQITFLPTYKFDHRTNTYDSSKKRRIPSYTDRILWKASPAVALLTYDSVPAISTSDHKPVYATFKCKIQLREADEQRPMRKYVVSSRACVIQ